MTTTTPAAGGAHGHGATASGAKLAAIPSEVAEAFLARLGEHGPDSIELALGAHEDDGTLIGVAAFGAVRADHGSLIVAVVPERRRLKIGSDLLLRARGRRGANGHPVVPGVLSRRRGRCRRAARTCGLTTARRVDAGTVTAVLDTTECPASE